jgi:hypothetical protein
MHVSHHKFSGGIQRSLIKTSSVSLRIVLKEKTRQRWRVLVVELIRSSFTGDFKLGIDELLMG